MKAENHPCPRERHDRPPSYNRSWKTRSGYRCENSTRAELPSPSTRTSDVTSAPLGSLAMICAEPFATGTTMPPRTTATSGLLVSTFSPSSLTIAPGRPSVTRTIENLLSRLGSTQRELWRQETDLVGSRPGVDSLHRHQRSERKSSLASESRYSPPIGTKDRG